MSKKHRLTNNAVLKDDGESTTNKGALFWTELSQMIKFQIVLPSLCYEVQILLTEDITEKNESNRASTGEGYPDGKRVSAISQTESTGARADVIPS